MQSDAKSVEEYLRELSPDREAALSTTRDVIKRHLPPGYEEAMNWGMISYQVPLADYPDTYNGQPLMYAALASQKRHMAIYLTGIYLTVAKREEFEQAYRATGKRFDVGKSCVRFKVLEDLPLELIGEVIASTSVAEFISTYKNVRGK